MYQTVSHKIKIKDINKAAKTDIQRLITDAEIAYDAQLQSAADEIINGHRNIILLTGPSSSGKTTSAKILLEKIRATGKHAERISLDNFYKPRDTLPLWRNGRKNYETVRGLDLSHLKSVFSDLASGGIVHFPIFDFKTGKRFSEKVFTINFTPETYLIFEGIHALTPQFLAITGGINCYKIYVSSKTDFVNKKIILKGRQLRLIRRIIRDEIERGASPGETINLWDDVCRGERLYIKPYRKYADFHISSVHSYEPLLYKQYLIEVFDKYENEHSEMKDTLIQAMTDFESIPKSLVPKTSLLREFMPSIALN